MDASRCTADVVVFMFGIFRNALQGEVSALLETAGKLVMLNYFAAQLTGGWPVVLPRKLEDLMTACHEGTAGMMSWRCEDRVLFEAILDEWIL